MSIGGNIRRQQDELEKLRRQQARRAERSKINVDGPLTGGQKKFVQELSHQTGLDPRAVGGWTLQEMSGPAAQGYDDRGYHNYLNIGHFDSGRGALTNEPIWERGPRAAARQTARFLRGEVYNPSESIRQILPRAKGLNTADTVDVVADSNWASDPDYRSKIHATSNMISTTGKPTGQKVKTRLTPDIHKMAKIATNRFDLNVAEHPDYGGVGKHSPNSHHYDGNAIDVTGDPERLMAYNQFLAERFGTGLAELFYDPGSNIKNGQARGPLGGHPTHVHVAVVEPGTAATGVYAPAGGYDPETGEVVPGPPVQPLGANPSPRRLVGHSGAPTMAADIIAGFDPITDLEAEEVSESPIPTFNPDDPLAFLYEDQEGLLERLRRQA